MKQITATILALLLLTACFDSRNTLVQLDAAQALISEHPDSALYYIQSIDRRKIARSKTRARYALLYSQALDKNYIDVDKDTLIRIAMDYHTKRGSANDKALAYYYSGCVYENGGNADSAILQYANAEQYVAKTDNTYLKGLIANALASQYAKQQFRTLARSKYREAATHWLAVGNKRNAMYTHWGILSLSVTDIDQNIQTKDDIAIAEQLALELNDTIYLQGLARIRAKHDVLNCNYESALKILRSNDHKYNGGIVSPANYFILGDIYIHLNKLDSAYLYLKPLLDNLDSPQSRNDAEVHYLVGKLMEMKGDYRQANKHIMQALVVIDSIYFAEKDFSIPELKQRHNNEQLTLQNKYLRTIAKYQICITLLLSIGILTIIIVLIRRRKATMRRHNIELADQQTIIAALRKKFDDLKEINDSNSDDSYLSSILERRIDFIKNTLEATALLEYDKDLYYRKIKEFLVAKDNAQNDNAMLLFQDMLDAKHPGILNYLQEKYVDLTEDDINLYCLICLHISLPAICLVLGHKPKTIYNYRNKLRGKLNIRNENIEFSEHFAINCAEQSKSKTQIIESEGVTTQGHSKGN